MFGTRFRSWTIFRAFPDASSWSITFRACGYAERFSLTLYRFPSQQQNQARTPARSGCNKQPSIISADADLSRKVGDDLKALQHRLEKGRGSAAQHLAEHRREMSTHKRAETEEAAARWRWGSLIWNQNQNQDLPQTWSGQHRSRRPARRSAPRCARTICCPLVRSCNQGVRSGPNARLQGYRAAASHREVFGSIASLRADSSSKRSKLPSPSRS